MRVALPDLVSNSYFPAIAAADLGFFQREGLDAEIELLFPVPKTMEGLRDGRFAFVAGAAHAVLTAFPEWRGARLLAALAQHTYWLLVVRADRGVRRGDLQALRGLRLGAAPGVDLSLRRLLREAGLDPDRDVQIGPVPGTSASASFGVLAAQALAAGAIDGFWANAMGAEVAVRRGVGTVVLDVRRGDGPPAARHYTFPALVTTERLLAEQPRAAEAAVRALVAAQRALRADPARATEVGRKRFPPEEAELIAELIRRDAPYYDPAISPETVARLNQFAQDVGLLARPVPYEQVVAAQVAPLWTACDG
ncbi:MAG TPA: ABC transporter substrate-binding protein [Chloroflexota bacterium]|jgi:NitT/TauT family transport system substrate-binding protein|nr:ABC transporter substrate-binding protein [Chloroflexota bacterium]